MSAAPVPESPPIAVPRLDGLTSLRFFAALGVVFCHLALITQGGVQERVTASGFVGVTFFFILSGFVLTWSFRPGSAARFYGRRLARIWPLHALTWAVALTALPQTRGTAVEDAASLMLVQTWGPDGSPFTAGSAYHPVANGVSWTLSVELAFYLTVPFVVPRLLRASQGTLVGLLALACGAEFLLQQVIRGVWPLAAGSMLLLGPPYRYIEFLVGALIAALLLSGMSISARIRPAALFVALVYLIASTHDVWIRNSDVNAAMMLPFAALIATTAASGLQRRASLERRWLVGRGNASFALYLVHYPIVLAVARLAHDQPFAARLLLALAALGLSLVTAEVAHAWFEKPVERALRARIDRVAPAESPIRATGASSSAGN